MSQQSVDRRLNDINSIIEQYIEDNITNGFTIQEHQYLSPIQHHKSFLTLHSIVINTDLSDFEHLFPDLSKSNRNIYLKKLVIFRITPHAQSHAHVLDLSPLDLLCHFDRLREVFNKFNASTYDYHITKSLDKDDDYQQYLYSYKYIEDIIKNDTNHSHSDCGILMTVPSNLYFKTNYKYNMILVPKYYEYDPSTQLYTDLDSKIFNTYCRTHTPLFDLQTLKLYIDPPIAKKYFKSTLDALYRIHGYVDAKDMRRFSNPNALKYNKEMYSPSRIWDNYLFNLHPSMLYINNHIHWSTFIQIFVNIFQITTHHLKTSHQNILMNPTCQGFTENDLQHTNAVALNIQIHSSGYRGGGGEGITDTMQYFAPELLPNYDPIPPASKPNKQTKTIVNRMTSLSLHSNAMSYSERALNIPRRQLLLDDVSSEVIDETAENDDVSGAFLTQSTTVIFNADMYGDDADGGAIICDETKDNDEDDTPMLCDSMSQPLKTKIDQIKKHKLQLKQRQDVDYLPCLWSLSTNIFAIGVMFFILMNGYPPFESASVKDRWYKEIAKNKFHKFWKLHRASPINAIPIPSAPISFTPSTMNVLSPRALLAVLKQTSISAQNVFPSGHSPVSPASPNTVLDLVKSTYVARTRAQTDAVAHAASTRHMQTESAMDVKHSKKKKDRTRYDYRSVQGLLNDVLRYDSCTRLEAFFNYNQNDLYFNNDVQPIYHKYWFLDIGFNDGEEYVDHSYNFSHFTDEAKQETCIDIDGKEALFLNVLNKLRYEKQEENRKKARQKKDEYVSSCICWMMDTQTDDPLDYPIAAAHVMMEGLCLHGSGELYTTKPWAKVLHSMYHIIQDNCCGKVDKEYTETHKRLICQIRLAKHNSELQKEEKANVIFEITIWKSIKWKQLNTKDETIWIVQWRRLHGNYLDYVRVINRIIHDQCAELFYLPKTIRRAMKQIS